MLLLSRPISTSPMLMPIEKILSFQTKR